MNKNATLTKTRLMRHLLQVVESQQKDKAALAESGTSTTDLSPATNATRQLAKDIAASGRPGIPSPPNAQSDERNPAKEPAVLDPNGEDKPADIGHMYGTKGETKGMTIPADIKPNPSGPATDTTAPGSDTSTQTASDVAKAKAKSGRGLKLESATPDDVVAFLIEQYGNDPSALAFALVADGAPFELAEAIANGEIDFNEADERILDRLLDLVVKFNEQLEGNDVDYAAMLEAADGDVWLQEAIDEGFIDEDLALKLVGELIDNGTLKEALMSIFKKKEPSAGYLRVKAAHDSRVNDHREMARKTSTIGRSAAISQNRNSSARFRKASDGLRFATARK